VKSETVGRKSPAVFIENHRQHFFERDERKFRGLQKKKIHGIKFSVTF
jgi:hypothetical protein